ncbi:ferritin [Myxococcota bacterium]
MLSPKMLEALNQQINNELASSYLYLAMASYMEAQTLPGTAHWLKRQAAEENSHAMKLFDYVADRGAQVVLGAIAQPSQDFGSAQQLFERVLAHERNVTASIHALYETAQSEKDYATQVMLHWFINEQVEEEKSAGAIVDQLRMIPERSTALLYLDRQLGKRA